LITGKNNREIISAVKIAKSVKAEHSAALQKLLFSFTLREVWRDG